MNVRQQQLGGRRRFQATIQTGAVWFLDCRICGYRFGNHLQVQTLSYK